MINIISKSINSDIITGPKKVVVNLIKGLDILGYSYCINKKLSSTSQLWIHDDVDALKEASNLKIKAIVGPNLYILPRHIPHNINLSNFVYLHPSQWAVDFWHDFGFNRCKLHSWPVGIDTDEFFERTKPEHGTVLIYFKQRYQKELNFIKNILEQKNIKYSVITYGSYNQKDYLKILESTRYIIWLGRQESQGIALEEALSMNIPILVWDVKNIGHWLASYKEMSVFNELENNYTNTSSAYYFDNRCGLKIKNESELPASIDLMEKTWRNFTPRKYIIENLNLGKQAKELIDLYESNFNISYQSGLDEKLLTNKKWRNSKLYFIFYTKLKDFVKKIFKK